MFLPSAQTTEETELNLLLQTLPEPLILNNRGIRTVRVRAGVYLGLLEHVSSLTR